VTSSRLVNETGFPTSRRGFPASLEAARLGSHPVPSYAASTGIWLSASPAVASQRFAFHRPRGFYGRQRLRVCTLVKHGSVFTRGTNLPRNPQALFRCQGTIRSLSHILEQMSTKETKGAALS